MSRYAFIAATLGLTVFAQLLTKSRSLSHDQATGDQPLAYLLAMIVDVKYLVGLMAAFIASFCWVLAIQKTQLSVAYPFMALSFILVPIGSAFLFGDRVSAFQMLGGAFIVAGVMLSAFTR